MASSLPGPVRIDSYTWVEFPSGSEYFQINQSVVEPFPGYDIESNKEYSNELSSLDKDSIDFSNAGRFVPHRRSWNHSVIYIKARGAVRRGRSTETVEHNLNISKTFLSFSQDANGIRYQATLTLEYTSDGMGYFREGKDKNPQMRISFLDRDGFINETIWFGRLYIQQSLKPIQVTLGPIPIRESSLPKEIGSVEFFHDTGGFVTPTHYYEAGGEI